MFKAVKTYFERPKYTYLSYKITNRKELTFKVKFRKDFHEIFREARVGEVIYLIYPEFNSKYDVVSFLWAKRSKRTNTYHYKIIPNGRGRYRV